MLTKWQTEGVEMLISLVVAVDEHNGLGKNNQLLCHLPADLKHFKNLTLGKTIIMGKNTYDSIGKPLPQRQNIVLTSKSIEIDGVDIAHSFEEALQIALHKEEIMVIGGASLYKQTINLADKIYLTRIHHHFDADVFFPEINEANWEVSEKLFRAADDKNAFDLSFFTLIKK